MSNKIWSFAYEPKTIDEIIIKDDFKKILQSVIEKKPNLLLHGHAGTGKGTFVNIFLRETKCPVRKINCSDETGVDTIREKVKSFAQAMGTPGEMKIVYLNEADYLSINAQALLRDLLESVQKTTRFIFACNYINKMIPEVLSRCQIIEFSSPPGKKIYQHCLDILKAEGIKEVNKESLVELIKRCYPDIRRTINTLQQNCIDGKFDTFVMRESDKVNQLILEKMVAEDVDKTRELIKSNPIDWTSLYEFLYEWAISNPDKLRNPGDFIIELGETMSSSNLVAIQEIHFMRMFFKLMKMKAFTGKA